MQTLLDALDGAARRDGRLTVLEETPVRMTYGDLARMAERHAASLAALQAPGQPLLFVLPTGVDFLRVFWGALWAGLVPSPVPQARPFGDMEEYAERLLRCSMRAGGAPVVTGEVLISILRDTEAGAKLRLVDVASIQEGPGRSGEPASLGLLQFTSGSLGDPKGVMLTHGALLADVGSIWTRIDGRRGDVAVSWLPLVHDLGLIGTHLLFLTYGEDQVLLPTERFIMEPELWLRAMHEFGGSGAASPPFGYAMAMRKGAPDGYDFSRWRMAWAGAEPVDARLLRRFVAHFAPSRLRPNVANCAYGMAECCVVATMAPADTPLSTVWVEQGLAPGTTVTLARPGAEGAIEICGNGFALDGMEAVVARDDGSPAAEREIGEVRLRGPMLFSGYWNDEAATAAAMDGGWLRTGDLGFYHLGVLYIAGRSKDVIIVGGRHFFPEEIEQTACEVAGVRPRGAAAFGEMDPSGGREVVTLVVETAVAPEDHARLQADIARRVSDRVGCAVDRFVFVEPRTLPRTPSGKLRRGESRRTWGGRR